LEDTIYTEFREQFLEDEEQAFRKMILKPGPLVHAHASRLLQNDSLVDDVVQDVFLRLWMNRGHIAEINNLTSWVLRITYNLCFSILRRRKIAEKSVSHIKEFTPGALNPEDYHHFQDTRRHIQDAINLLPKKAAQIYRLNREEGLKTAQIAAQLGISQQTVKNSLTRSLKFLREYLIQREILIPVFLSIFAGNNFSF